MLWILTALIAILLATLVFYINSKQRFFEKHGIPTLKSVFFLGNMTPSILGRRNFGLLISDAYKQFPDYKYFGFYKFFTHSVVIRDPELINTILVKDFVHFANNEVEAEENVDYIMSKNLFVLNDHKWKTMRQLLTPMFSSGKLKSIFPLVEEVSQRFVKYISKEIEENRNICVDGMRLCTKFTIDNVGNCAFGIESKAFEGETKFAEVATSFSDPSFVTSTKLLLIFVMPALQKMLKIKFFKDEVETYLTGIVTENLRYRKENNIVRNDFLDQINALKEKCTEYVFTDRDVVAQGAGFFIDGVETSAGVMNFVLFNIARHPDVQNKLREEIRQAKAKNNNTLSYEAVFELNYFDCVINESLRLHGPATVLFKVCTKEYTLPAIKADSDIRLALHPGDSVMIPIDGLHSDPDYFPNPEKYDPERFNDDNKSSISKYTFLPFGTGPRMCIGQRFGLLQIKLAIIAIISNFEISVNPKMYPFQVHPTALMRQPKSGFWFDIKHI